MYMCTSFGSSLSDMDRTVKGRAWGICVGLGLKVGYSLGGMNSGGFKWLI